MKKLICMLSLVLFCSINQSKAQLPASLSDIKWTESKYPGFLIANDGTKTEVVFDTYLRTDMKSIGEGYLAYRMNGSNKMIRSIDDKYKGFQIAEKNFERVDFSTLKAAKRIKFMQPLAKGKIDMYEYIWFTNSEIVDGVTKDVSIYLITYFFRNNVTGKEVFANEGVGIDKFIEIIKDNEKIVKDFSFRQYDVIEDKEGSTVKKIDLLKMVNDYNAAK